VAPGALFGKPIEPLSTGYAGSCFFLFLHALLNPMFLHITQILNHVGMVRNTIDNVNLFEMVKSLTGKFITFKTPRHILLFRTLPKAVNAFSTSGKYIS